MPKKPTMIKWKYYVNLFGIRIRVPRFIFYRWSYIVITGIAVEFEQRDQLGTIFKSKAFLDA